MASLPLSTKFTFIPHKSHHHPRISVLNYQQHLRTRFPTLKCATNDEPKPIVPTPTEKNVIPSPKDMALITIMVNAFKKWYETHEETIHKKAVVVFNDIVSVILAYALKDHHPLITLAAAAVRITFGHYLDLKKFDKKKDGAKVSGDEKSNIGMGPVVIEVKPSLKTRRFVVDVDVQVNVRELIIVDEVVDEDMKEAKESGLNVDDEMNEGK